MLFILRHLYPFFLSSVNKSLILLRLFIIKLNLFILILFMKHIINFNLSVSILLHIEVSIAFELFRYYISYTLSLKMMSSKYCFIARNVSTTYSFPSFEIMLPSKSTCCPVIFKLFLFFFSCR